MNYEFDNAVRGYHSYCRYWSPEENETLKCYHEIGNPFDIFPIKRSSDQDPRAVGHLPQEISSITKYLLERGTEIDAQLTLTQYRCSPITQGGLKILRKVIECMPATLLGWKLLDRYKELLPDLNSEPHTSELMESFLYDDIVEPSKENCTKMKKKAAQHTQYKERKIS